MTLSCACCESDKSGIRVRFGGRVGGIRETLMIRADVYLHKRVDIATAATAATARQIAKR